MENKQRTTKTTIVDASIDTLKSMLDEFGIQSKKCDNKDILNFAKNIGEEFAHANDKLSSSTFIGSVRKLELGEELLKLENEFSELNNKFNKCKCLK